ncbi:hypothetical protein CALCODRAFT_426062 [Calocera cornea HHB12733]|uniref:U3 small nucleolar RNA-associated protein 6 N-terminal domain-containing protein n=1 Tax=Calocera cornea HHB12733 TaxID=1353952 RepID=A0A165JZ40_9BASI|nr:hypothetical protein CALCODRAFT_426062 [Calocera cornea HHB12733]
MERVQYHQEQMLPELKDFVKKGIFSPAEVKEIIKRRTTFETSLVRRVADKADFLRYAQYEIGLEALRRKRLQRLKLPPSPPSISDYAIVRRQYYIFERAVRKFKADVSLWTEYIELARKNGARGLVGRLCARALQLHLNTPSIYVLAASHELAQGSPSSARSLLQRGLRFCPDAVELWTQYVKMELSYVEGLRRRRDVLGIQDEPDAAGRVNEAVSARQEVLNGAVVMTVMESAAKSLPTLDLFKSLLSLFESYPSPLAPNLTSHLLDLLQRALPSEPEACLMRATVAVESAFQKGALVDSLKAANESLMEDVSTLGVRMSQLYTQWVNLWARKLDERHGELVRDSQDVGTGTLLLTANRPNTFASVCDEFPDSRPRPRREKRLWSLPQDWLPSVIGNSTWLWLDAVSLCAMFPWWSMLFWP